MKKSCQKCSGILRNLIYINNITLKIFRLALRIPVKLASY